MNLKKSLILFCLFICSCYNTEKVSNSQALPDEKSYRTNTEWILLTGTVYDNNGNLLENAKISIDIMDNIEKYPSYYNGITFTTDSKGVYYFRNMVVGSSIKIKVSKDGYKAIEKVVKINSDFSKGIFIVNFGDKEDNYKNALEKIN